MSRFRPMRLVGTLAVGGTLVGGAALLPTGSQAFAEPSAAPSVSWGEGTVLEQSNQGATGNAMMRADSLPYYEDDPGLERVFGGVRLVYEGDRNQPGFLKTQGGNAVVKNFPAGHYYVHCVARGKFGAFVTNTEFDVTDPNAAKEVYVHPDVTMTSGTSACYFSSRNLEDFQSSPTKIEDGLGGNRAPSLGYVAPAPEPYRWGYDPAIVTAEGEQPAPFFLESGKYTTFVDNKYYNMITNVPEPKEGATPWSMDITAPDGQVSTGNLKLVAQSGMNAHFRNQANSSITLSKPGTYQMKLKYLGYPIADDAYLESRAADGLALRLSKPALMRTQTEITAKALPTIEQNNPDSIRVIPPAGEDGAKLGRQASGYGIVIKDGDTDITKYFVPDSDGGWILKWSEETADIFSKGNVIHVEASYGQQVGASYDRKDIIVLAKTQPSITLVTDAVPTDFPTTDPLPSADPTITAVPTDYPVQPVPPEGSLTPNTSSSTSTGNHNQLPTTGADVQTLVIVMLISLGAGVTGLGALHVARSRRG